MAIYQVYYDPPESTRENLSICRYCITEPEDRLYRTPLLSQAYIDKLDFENQQIRLNKEGRKILKKLDIPLKGMAVALTLNGEVLYSFWLWNPLSSFGCDRVYALAESTLQLKFGLPGEYAFGEDPRFHKKLEAYVNE